MEWVASRGSELLVKAEQEERLGWPPIVDVVKESPVQSGLLRYLCGLFLFENSTVLLFLEL